MDPNNHSKIVRRIKIWQAALSVAGFAGWLIGGGALPAAGFALGAIASAASFTMLDRLTGVLGGQPSSAASLVVASIRILLIGGALFVIIRYYSLPQIAVATGIAVTIAAISIEAIRGFS